MNPGLILLASISLSLIGWLWNYLIDDLPVVSGWLSWLFEIVVLSILPLFIVGLLSCWTIGYARSAFGSRAVGTILGVLVFAFLITATPLVLLHLINELNDSMAMEGYSSLAMYSWRVFYAGGLPASAQFFAILWILSRTLNRSSS